ncbi:hypothetical protein DWW69_05770 [Bacteroides sp. AF16-49]|nr:hypothetical protein DXB63_09795 [Bacteroides sp. OM05-12]RHR77351.1 hypothetical protein DWW69_05770 [Bacteroides sp. AF16-49]
MLDTIFPFKIIIFTLAYSCKATIFIGRERRELFLISCRFSFIILMAVTVKTEFNLNRYSQIADFVFT